MKIYLILVGMLAMVSGCSARRANVAKNRPINPVERAEAIALVRNDTGRGPFIRKSEIASVVDAIRLVRTAFPEGHDIVSDAGRDLIIQLTDSAASSLAHYLPDGWHGDTLLHGLSLPSIDSALQRLGGHRTSVQVSYFARLHWHVRADFRQPVYTDGMAREFAHVSGARFVFDPTLERLGDGGGLTLSRHEPTYTFTFVRKWGDCLAGCINAHTWVFEVDLRTARVLRLREFGDAWPIKPAD